MYFIVLKLFFDVIVFKISFKITVIFIFYLDLLHFSKLNQCQNPHFEVPGLDVIDFYQATSIVLNHLSYQANCLTPKPSW